MKLTNNEKEVLKLLLNNAKISNSAIAVKLKISSQAVGKIRRKLEKSLINSYTVDLNFDKLGIHVLAMSLSVLTDEGTKKGESEIEKYLLEEPNIIQIYRLPGIKSKYGILYGFSSIEELENFFKYEFKKNKICELVENQSLSTFSYNSLIKNSSVPLLRKVLEDSE